MDSNPSRPILYVFAISHYCEKARWTLDHFGIDYTLSHLAPGSHIQVTSQLGATGSSLPLLVTDERVVQGSGDIISWADATIPDPAKRLGPEARFEEVCRDLEQRLDDVLGVHVRRYYYSEALVEYPESVQGIFTRDLPAAEREPLVESWGIVRQLMMNRMDLGYEQGNESRQIIEAELDWLDGLLADGRHYLVGERFSRADITAASLLAPLVRPAEHPTYGQLEVPPRASGDLAAWAERPSIAWTRKIYRDHRSLSASA